MEHDAEPFDHQQDTQATHINASDELFVPVMEEDLAATTREVERGAVRVSKDVVQEQRTLDVPVTEDEVEITRRRVDRPVTDAGHVFEEGTIEVPLRGEEIEVQKRARVVEEVDIDKTARQRTERVSGTVRREEVHVDEEGSVVEIDAARGRRSDNR
jgi:uncharacterized protein (TIGR02271 family)